MVVVVVEGGAGTALLLLLFAKIKIPSPMTTPAPTSQSRGGLVVSVPCACLTPAAGAAGSGPVSADIAGNGAMTRAALTTVEIIDFFTLSSPDWVILLRSLPSHRNTVKQKDTYSQHKISTTLNGGYNNCFLGKLQKCPSEA